MTEPEEVSGEIPEWVQHRIEEIIGCVRKDQPSEATDISNPLLYLADRVKQQAKEIAELKDRIETLNQDLFNLHLTSINRITTLSKDKERLKKQHDISRAVLLADIEAGSDRVFDLEIENQKLVKDKERLDKLEEHLMHAHSPGYGSVYDDYNDENVDLWRLVTVHHSSKKHDGVGKTIREAIDSMSIPEVSNG